MQGYASCKAYWNHSWDMHLIYLGSISSDFSCWVSSGCTFRGELQQLTAWLASCSIVQSCLTLHDPMDCSTPGFPVLQHLLESAQTHVHWVSDGIQPPHPLSPPSPSALSLFQLQGLFQWVSSSHQVAKVLELRLQHQSFQWIFKVDFL